MAMMCNILECYIHPSDIQSGHVEKSFMKIPGFFTEWYCSVFGKQAAFLRAIKAYKLSIHYRDENKQKKQKKKNKSRKKKNKW
jgi:hypothetical protein